MDIKIVAPIVGPDMDTAMADIEAANEMPSVYGVEIRYDMIKNPNLADLMTAPKGKVMFTNMRTSEGKGGHFDGNHQEWGEIAKQALEFKPAYLSIGANYYDGVFRGERLTGTAFPDEVFVDGPLKGVAFPEETAKIWAYHDFEETPHFGQLRNLYDQCRDSHPQPDIVKVAVKANSFREALKILNFVDYVAEQGKKVIGLPMGRYGGWVRAMCCFLGAELTFAALSEDKTSADGQPTVSGLETALKEMHVGTFNQVD